MAALSIIGAGVLGLVSMATVRRTRELGIRVALGATRRGIAALVVREQMAAISAGLIAGGVGSTWTVQLFRSYVYDTLSVYDARVWAAAVAVVVITAGLGTLIPALRASRADPVHALRVE